MNGEGLGAWDAIRLIAGREVRSRGGSKSFRLITLGFALAVILGGALLHQVVGSVSPATIGVQAADDAVEAQIEAAAAGAGADVDVTTVPNRAAGEEQLRSGGIDVLVTATEPTLDLLVLDELDPALQAMFGVLAKQLALIEEVTALGGDPAEVTTTIAAAAPNVESLQPQPETNAGQVAVGAITGILLFIALMTAGQYVAQGVVEEKSSRVVELLLSSVSPNQLMAGKVLGIGLVGLAQVAIVAAAGVGTAVAFDLVDPASVNLGAAAGWALVWFVIGFATFALILAALASLVSRQEEVAGVIAPVTWFMVIPYIVAVSIAPSDPYNTLVVVLSYIPLCAPLLMPIRIAMEAVEPWQVALSLALSLAVIPLLVMLGGRIYSNAVLRTGSRVRLRDALRKA